MKPFIVRFHEIIQVQVQSTFDDPMAMPASGPAGLLQEVPAPADLDLNVPENGKGRKVTSDSNSFSSSVKLLLPRLLG